MGDPQNTPVYPKIPPKTGVIHEERDFKIPPLNSKSPKKPGRAPVPPDPPGSFGSGSRGC